jgi:DNA-binding Xre family transcriptional regulator
MVELKVRELAEAKEIKNPLTLSQVSGLAYATCHKIWNDPPVMIGLETLDRLCEALDCELADLLVRTSSKSKSKR